MVGEATSNECLENRQFVRMVDITFDANPIGVETWMVPEASGNFCDRGGRFGAHASHEDATPIYYGRCKTAIQSNNPEVDDRGYIYIADRANTGLHIVEQTAPAAGQGAARAVKASGRNDLEAARLKANPPASLTLR